jgi:hypothetical protein
MENTILETVKSGDPISIKADGTVEVGQQGRLLMLTASDARTCYSQMASCVPFLQRSLRDRVWL